MQPVGLVDVLELAAGVGAGVEQRVGELPVVADRDRHLACRRAARKSVMSMSCGLASIDPLERRRVAVLGLGEQHAGVGRERVGAHPVDDLDRVVVVAAAVAERVRVRRRRPGSGRRLSKRDVDAREPLPASGLTTRAGTRATTRPDSSSASRDSRSTFASSTIPSSILLRSMCCAPIEAPPVGGIIQRLCGPPGPLKRAAAEHLPDAGVGAPRRDAERVVVVVADAEDVAELVRVDGHAGALGLGRRSRRRRSARSTSRDAHEVHST